MQFAIISVMIFSIGVAPLLASDAYAASGISSAVADDPDDGDAAYSVGDTIVITFPAQVNSTFASGTMTNAEFRANFTVATTDIDTADTVTGVWNAGATALTLTINTIAGVDPPTINTDTILYDSAAGNIHYQVNGTEFTNSAITLTGDFGLFTASSSNSGGSGCSGDCEEPTLGVDSRGTRMVSDGFTYNGHSVNVERFFTPYPLITAEVGKENKAEFKIYENGGPENIRHFSFAFGLAKDQIISESKAMIELDIDFDGTKTLTVTDPENALDNISVETKNVSCDGGPQENCLGITIYHTFRAPLDFNIVATDVWDKKRNPWQNYYNHGIEVVGDSLNPPNKHAGIYKGQIYELTEVTNTIAVDELGNLWSLKYDKWEKEYVPSPKIADKLSMNGYTRDNSKFEIYKQGQQLIAEYKLLELCPECFDASFEELDRTFYYEFPERINKLEDPQIKQQMNADADKAQQIMNLLIDTLYRK